MNVEANPKSIFMARLNLNGFVGVIRHLAGIGRKPKLTFVSLVDKVDTASSSTGTIFPSGTSPADSGAVLSFPVATFSGISKEG